MDPTTAPDSFTTIDEIDAAVEDILAHSLPEVIIYSRFTSFELPFYERSYELRRLTVMKYLCRQSADVTRHQRAEEQHNRVAIQSEDITQRHFEGFKRAFQEINYMSGNPFGNNQVQYFLDLGCAPGGSATWVLQNNRNARGVGVTLSPEAKGIRIQLGTKFLKRFRVQYGDVCEIATGRATIGEIPDGGFELVLANAAIMLADDIIPWADTTRLVYAQLLVSLQHIAQGGSLVIGLRSLPLRWIVDIVRLLGQAFASIKAENPSYQGRRPFAYIVCKGFSATDEEKVRYIHRLGECIEYLGNITGPVDDPSGGTANIPRLCGTQDETIPEETYQHIVDMFANVWERQYNAIHSNYEKVLLEQQARERLNAQTSVGENIAGGPWQPVGRRPVAQPNEGGPCKWSRPTAPPDDIYRKRRMERNAAYNTFFSRRDSASGSADGPGTWRRS
ncbi:uncharacterized protein B0H18DRAFT_1008117 [Fomitopsis serialis]|uniref:uncharacterized protein n=1 Tax=Fomitopsis serialis TaxID=139415 RepID=UPI0020083F8E|nr:uncharacterized protein B0H18DRAFT_1008117 [Neoantrodia serialis]KAH9925761.1 hypothetical protein B0H18DRAFT_1008117 [Neoantrodia serialis]